jgi:hypothetical protein
MVDNDNDLEIKPLNKCVKDGDIPSRSHGYRGLKDGTYKGKKVGSRTYLVMSSVRAAKAALPDYVPLSQRTRA